MICAVVAASKPPLADAQEGCPPARCTDPGAALLLVGTGAEAPAGLAASTAADSAAVAGDAAADAGACAVAVASLLCARCWLAAAVVPLTPPVLVGTMAGAKKGSGTGELAGGMNFPAPFTCCTCFLL